VNHLVSRCAALLCCGLLAGAAWAEKKYGPGVTDTEIKIGNTAPYSGPVSAYGTIAKTHAAYFRKINDEGGINGRKINFISLDDAYSPPRTMEQVRRLVEQDQVFALFQNIGTAPNSAIQKYTNSKKVPALFIGAVSEKLADPRNFPWTMPWNAPATLDGSVFGKWLLKEKPAAKIAVLYQNDDLGKDYVRGLKTALGEKAASMIAAEASYETSDPTIDSQIITLKASGADTLFAAVTPKFGAQAIRKVYDIGWRPTFLLSYTASSVETVLKPASLEKSTGLITAYYTKADTATFKDDPAYQDYLAFMKKYYPDGDPNDAANSYGYAAALSFADLLQRCGDELTRENLMRQATTLKNVQNPMLLPGILLNTSPTDYHPIEQMQMLRFDGARWVRFGEVIGHD
jgi:ABC-type branched-subunit amino acid transport system substrate-binding protein